MLTRKTIAIIGAGPSGLMAAETLASAGYGVTIYDRMPSPARKFLMAGRGGLNLTHSEPLELFLTRYREAADWLAPHIRSLPPEALRAWCEALGQETYIGSSGRVFPRSMKAAPLLRAWLGRLNTLGVKFAAQHTWHGWREDSLYFTNANGEDVLIKPDATLLAMGGASWPRLGSDGGWAAILAARGVSISPLRPANCGFIAPWSEHFSARFAGMPLKPISLTHGSITQQGEMMITAQGLEGGAIYALSAPLREAIEKEGTAALHVDLRPGMTLAALTQKLQAPRANQSLSTYLRKAGFPPQAIGLLREVTTPDMLAQASAVSLAMQLKNLPVTLRSTTGLPRAISSAGGIMRSELTPDLMLKNMPGLFAAGEMLDWEAPTGGYLLQACFSTALSAAKGIIAYCGE